MPLLYRNYVKKEQNELKIVPKWTIISILLCWCCGNPRQNPIKKWTSCLKKLILMGQLCEGLSWLLSNAWGLNSPWVVPFPGQVVLNYIKAQVVYKPAANQAASSQPQWCLLSFFGCEVSSFIRSGAMEESKQACLLPSALSSCLSDECHLSRMDCHME